MKILAFAEFPLPVNKKMVLFGVKVSKSYNYISARNNDHAASHPHQLTKEPLIEKMKLLNLTNLSEQKKKARVLTMTF